MVLGSARSKHHELPFFFNQNIFSFVRFTCFPPGIYLFIWLCQFLVVAHGIFNLH